MDTENPQGQEEELDTTPDNPEENPEENDTPTNEEGTDNPELSETEKSGKSDSEIKSLLAQKEHWRKKALEAEKKSQPKKEQKPSASGSEDEWRHKVDFLLENRDVSEEEFDHLAAVASRRSGSVSMDSLRDAQKQEKDYISYRRKKAEEKKKVPGSTAAGSTSRNKGPKEIAKMSEEEFRAYEEEQNSQEERGI